MTNESICAIVMKLGKQNRLDSSGFPLSNCICNSSFVFMCGCEWHCFPLDLVGWGPRMTTLIHRALALKSIFYRHPLKRIAVNSHFSFIGLNILDFQPMFVFIVCKAFDITYRSEVLISEMHKACFHTSPWYVYCVVQSSQYLCVLETRM